MRTDTWSAVVAALLLVSSSFVHSAARAGRIHDAAKAGDPKQVESLIAAGADVDDLTDIVRYDRTGMPEIGQIQPPPVN